MHPNPRRVAPVVLVVVLALAGYWYFVMRPAQDTGALSASGTVEITQIQIAPELGGKAVAVQVAEGDAVKQGDVLIQLDTTLMKAQRAQAAAALAVAEANGTAAQANAEAAQSTVEAAQFSVDAAQASFDLLEVGASPEQLTATQAQFAQAEANRLAAEASFAALTAGARPEDVSAAHLQLDLARQAYYSLTVTLSEEQVADLTTATTTAATNVSQAEARLAELKNNSALPAAGLEAAQAAVNGATASAAQINLAVTRPLYQQITSALQSWTVAQLNLSQAQARQTLLQNLSDIPQAALDAASAEVEDAQKLVDDTKAAYDSLNTSAQGDQLRAAWNTAQTALAELNRMGRGTATTVEAALNQLDAVTALTNAAGANLAALQNGARDEQTRAAQAQLSAAQAQLEAAQARTEAAQAQATAAQAQADMAQAALNILDIQISKLTIVAPADGVILTRMIEPGEMALPNATLLVLGQTAEKTITVYIPEDRYGQLAVGQTAELRVDSLDTPFTATVLHIADKAEFTPRNVQTAQGRKNTVFAIRLTVDDPDGKLIAGMPADVEFKEK